MKEFGVSWGQSAVLVCVESSLKTDRDDPGLCADSHFVYK